jgi:hypothetical protein
VRGSYFNVSETMKMWHEKVWKNEGIKKEKKTILDGED